MRYLVKLAMSSTVHSTMASNQGVNTGRATSMQIVVYDDPLPAANDDTLVPIYHNTIYDYQH